MKAASSVLEGCLRDLELDGRVIGLPDVLETVDIRAGCVCSGDTNIFVSTL